MVLNKDGLIYKILKWYGYPDWRLEEGISLCKTFWSIMLGVIVLAPVRALAWAFARAEKQFGKRGYQVFFVGTLATLLFLLNMAFGGTVTESLIALLFAGSLVAIPVTVVFLIRRLVQSSVVERWEDSADEVVAVVGSFVKAAKQRACPTIRFSE